MKNRKSIALLLLLVAVGLLIWWYAAGAHLFTSTERMVQVKDELFGTVTEKWEKGFTPGIESIGPIAGVLIIAALIIGLRKPRQGA